MNRRGTVAFLTSACLVAIHSADAQQTATAPTPTPAESRLPSSRWSLPGINVSPLLSGSPMRPSREPVTRFGTNPIVTTGPDRRGLQHFDAVNNSVSSVPTIDGGGLRRSPSLVKPLRTNRDVLPVRVGQPASGIGGSGDGALWPAPVMIYPDDVVLVGSRVYGRSLGEAFRAGKDIGRLETLNRNALDMYNERVGNPPADPAAPSSDRGGYVIGSGPDLAFLDAYLAGKRTGQSIAELESARDRNLLRTAADAIRQGLTLFKAGRYEEAADAFRIACSSNHGDAAARILAGHAYFATGRYGQAMSYIRRAFQLQPKITYLNFDLRRDYGRPEDFDKHLKALREYLDSRPRDYSAWLLLGYVQRYGGDREGSVGSLRRAYEIEPRDRLVRMLLDVEADPAH